MNAPRPGSTPRGPTLKVRLASPRGFCAGVERAIRTVEETLKLHGAPVYVRHEIVHNKHVVARLAAMGAIFVEELDAVPQDRPVVFSAHGAPKSAHEEAARRNLVKIDATCPLVTKVHAETRRHIAAGRHVLLIGHENHPEVIGTMGQAPEGAVTLIQTEAEARALAQSDAPLAYVTQTTLSVDETRGVIDILKERFPHIRGPSREDICYATSNRQAAVKATAPGVDLYVVIGSSTSSNSARLVETALDAGAAYALLTDDADSFDWDLCENISSMGLSAGASAPETLVEEFLTTLALRRPIAIESIETAKEDIVFKSPLRLAS